MSILKIALGVLAGAILVEVCSVVKDFGALQIALTSCSAEAGPDAIVLQIVPCMERHGYKPEIGPDDIRWIRIN